MAASLKSLILRTNFLNPILIRPGLTGFDIWMPICVSVGNTHRKTHHYTKHVKHKYIINRNRIKSLLLDYCIYNYNNSNIISTSSSSNNTINTTHTRTIEEPQTIVKDDLNSLYTDAKNDLQTDQSALLQCIAHYLFDGTGKAFRPTLVTLIAKACNIHINQSSKLLSTQLTMARVCEMIHTASLVHDDVIDMADTRRSKTTINTRWGEKNAIFTGNFILSRASLIAARLGDTRVVDFLSTIIEDLVKGEFMQLGSKMKEDERFSHYLSKTFKKTASLMAYSCRAVAVLGGASEDVEQTAFEFGKNFGMAFQLTDDVLDFISNESILGKPAAADLRLGLANAPVLFAAQKFPELNAMILRRFTQTGDVELAYQFVRESDGVEQTTFLAQKYAEEAARVISELTPSPEREALVSLTHRVITRQK